MKATIYLVATCGLMMFALATYASTETNERVFSTTMGALFQPSVYFAGEMRAHDRIERDGLTDINVESGNLETSDDPDYQLAQCVLKNLGFELPASRQGVYWGRWDDDGYGHQYGSTVDWTGALGYRLSYSFINVEFRGFYQRACEGGLFDFLATFYHEIKGHNVDGAQHDTNEDTENFDLHYEDPIRKRVLSSDTCALVTRCLARP